MNSNKLGGSSRPCCDDAQTGSHMDPTLTSRKSYTSHTTSFPHPLGVSNSYHEAIIHVFAVTFSSIGWQISLEARSYINKNLSGADERTDNIICVEQAFRSTLVASTIFLSLILTKPEYPA